jgi:hypothetical protein
LGLGLYQNGTVCQAESGRLGSAWG